MKTIFIFLLLSTDIDMTLDATAVYGLQTLEQCNFILETVKGDVPENVRNVIETRFMNKEDKEFQDSKEFAINSLKNK